MTVAQNQNARRNGKPTHDGWCVVCGAKLSPHPSGALDCGVCNVRVVPIGRVVVNGIEAQGWAREKRS